MTEEELNPTDTGADTARSSLADAIASVEADGPVRKEPPAEEQAVSQAADVAQAMAQAQETKSARSALEAAVLAAEVSVAEDAAVQSEADQAFDAAPEPEPVWASGQDDFAAVTVVETVSATEELVPQPEPESFGEPEAASQSDVVTPEPAEAATLDDMIESLNEPAQQPEEAQAEPAQQPEEAQAEAPATEAAPEGADPAAVSADVASAAAATVAAVEPASAKPVVEKPAEVSLWPFLVYFGIWIVYTGLFMWKYLNPDFGEPTFADPFYLYFMVVLVALVITGPMVALATWMTSWNRPGATKSDLLVSALVRGSVATFGGISVWFLGYFVLDLMRMSRVR